MQPWNILLTVRYDCNMGYYIMNITGGWQNRINICNGLVVNNRLIIPDMTEIIWRGFAIGEVTTY